MNLKDLLEQAIIEEKQHANTKKVPVGQVSDKLRREYKQVQLAKREFSDELELRIEQLERETRRKIAAEFDDKIYKLEQAHEHIWQKIYKELQIKDAEDKSYSINTKDGTISERVEEDPFNFI